MIYPTDFRQRVQKQHKSRMYKAMLDQQVRQNHIYSTYQPMNNNIHTKRYKSQQTVQQPLYSAGQHNNYNKYKYPINQVKLLSPVSKNLINHEFKYIPSHDLTRMGNLNNFKRYDSNSKGYNNNNMNSRMNQQSYNDVNNIDKCLDQCNHIINNIKKSYIKISGGNNNNNNNGSKGNNNINNNNKSNNNNNGSGLKKCHYHGNNSYTNRKVQPLNQQYTVDDDVGRNQMMNYVLSKSRMNQMNGNGSPKRNQYSIKKINYKSNINNNKKSKIRSKSQMMGDQDQLALLQAQEKKRKQHQMLLKRDKNILEYLRKAKNKGGVLYKKIEMFKKQSQTIEKSGLQESSTIADTQAQNSQNKNFVDSQIKINQQSISLTKSHNTKQTNRQEKNKSQLSNISNTTKK